MADFPKRRSRNVYPYLRKPEAMDKSSRMEATVGAPGLSASIPLQELENQSKRVVLKRKHLSESSTGSQGPAPQLVVEMVRRNDNIEMQLELNYSSPNSKYSSHLKESHKTDTTEDNQNQCDKSSKRRDKKIKGRDNGEKSSSSGSDFYLSYEEDYYEVMEPRIRKWLEEVEPRGSSAWGSRSSSRQDSNPGRRQWRPPSSNGSSTYRPRAPKDPEAALKRALEEHIRELKERWAEAEQPARQRTRAGTGCFEWLKCKWFH